VEVEVALSIRRDKNAALIIDMQRDLAKQRAEYDSAAATQRSKFDQRMHQQLLEQRGLLAQERAAFDAAATKQRLDFDGRNGSLSNTRRWTSNRNHYAGI